MQLFPKLFFISFLNSMEVTPLVVLPQLGRYPSSFNQHAGLFSSYPMYSLNSRNKSPQLHPSLFQDESKQQQEQQQQQQRIFFSALSLANFFNNKGSVTYTTFKTGKLNWNVFFCFLNQVNWFHYLNNRNQNGSEEFPSHFFRRELHTESFPIQRLLGETLKV